MISVLSRSQIRALDRHAIEQCGVPGIVLMENAGRGATDAIERWLGRRRAGGLVGARIVVVAGRGNNGGDGCVVARHLALRGARSTLLLTVARADLAGDAALACTALVGTGGALEERATPGRVRAAVQDADVVVDALFGTGLDRDLEERGAALVAALGSGPAPVVALDLPSGIDADHGQVRGAAVRAALTVTFAHPKPGLFASNALDHVGELVVVDIGVAAELARAVGATAELCEPADAAQRVARRRRNAHKGAAGRVVLFAGSPGTLGAALLAATGALRAGAGLVTLAAAPEVADALDRRVLEVMTARLDAGAPAAAAAELAAGAHAVAVGPGLGRSERAGQLVTELAERCPRPLVIDADALTLLGADPGLLRGAAGPRLLTPHPGELGRLLGLTAGEVEADRLDAVARAVELTGAVVLLKGPRTVVGAPGSLPVINATGNPALATGGAGDVLTGIATALGCHLPLRDAAILAAYLHGLAADRWALRVGADRGLLAHEIADELPMTLAAVAGAEPLVPN